MPEKEESNGLRVFDVGGFNVKVEEAHGDDGKTEQR